MGISEETLSRWYELYSDAIFKYLCMLTRDYQTAQDLTQETFIRAFHHIDDFKQMNEKGWLFRIAHNMTMDYFRKKKPLIAVEKLFLMKKDERPQPEDILEMREDIRELYKALGRMKKNYREVIILRKIKEFSIEETSLILNWSESKVKTTLHRAMKQLEQELNEEGYVYESI